MNDETEVKSPNKTTHYPKMNTSSPETKRHSTQCRVQYMVIMNLVINTSIFNILVGA